jgi:peptidoglycan/xylan/chitin deacetylase (PgdA/CDA1 family)
VLDPPRGVVSGLPGEGSSLALTIDDGTNSAVVAAFVALAARTGIRLTFFPNGRYRSWQDNAPALRPLVDSGQVTLGNHTWSHPDVTTLDDRALTEEIRRNKQFLWSTYGVQTPFFRPPYGAHNAHSDAVAADLGHPTIALWNGTLGDFTVISPAQLVAGARQWFTAQRIVIGHANHQPVTTVFGELLDLIAERNLHTVTLADVWASPSARLRGASATGRAHTR